MSNRVNSSQALGAWSAVVLVVALSGVPGMAQSAARASNPTCAGQPATIVGTSRHDDLTGTQGPDVILGRGGDDYIFGMGGDDVVCAGPGSDFVEDAFGANEVFGGRGADWMKSGHGDERFHGGPGRDVVDYSQRLLSDGEETHCRAIHVDLGAGSGEGQGFGVDQLFDVEGAYSGGGDDVLIGDDASNSFYVGMLLCGRSQSDDNVNGLGGSDTLTFASEQIEGSSADGRVQADLRTGEAVQKGNGGVHNVSFTSIENLDGTDLRDTLIGNDAPNVFNAGWKGFWLEATSGDVIHAGGGADTILGMNGKDDLHGGPGPDMLGGRHGDDALWGDDGNDSLDGGRGSNENHGGAGSDECRRPSAGPSTFGCEAP